MQHNRSMLIALLVVCLPLVAIALALAFGGPVRPTAMSSINDPFKSVDFSDLPPVATFQADDGKALAYRVYHPSAVPLGSVTLIHGSSASSNSMHPMAKALAAAGYKVFALDVRGHGHPDPPLPALAGVQGRDLGLMSEDTHPLTGEMWGNYPQTYSMVGIINAAVRLSADWDTVI